MINVVIYEPEIPQNCGNIMRTCAGTDVKLHLIKPLGFSLDEKAVRRSGANYVENCDYIIYEDYKDFETKNTGEFYFLENFGNKTYSDVDYTNKEKNIYLIFGSESSGIPKEIIKPHFERCLRIPTNNKVRSLNLSNTVALVVYEVLRQQNFNELDLYDTIKGKNYINE